jgi:hypothetical protein
VERASQAWAEVQALLQAWEVERASQAWVEVQALLQAWEVAEDHQLAAMAVVLVSLQGRATEGVVANLQTLAWVEVGVLDYHHLQTCSAPPYHA